MNRPASVLGALLLHRPDDAVESFYRRVFGWRLDAGVFTAAGEPRAAAFATDDAAPGWLPIFSDVAGGTEVGPWIIDTDNRGARYATPESDVGLDLYSGYSSTHGTSGKLCWLQLNSRDVAASAAHYRSRLGWTTGRSPNDKFTYEDFVRDGEHYAGLMEIDGRSGTEVPEVWQLYFRATDVTACAAAISAAGGEIVVPPTVLVDVEFAVARDAFGYLFAVERRKDEGSA